MKLGICLVIGLMFFSLASSAHAAFVTVRESGEVTWNVLASEVGIEMPKRSSLEVKDVSLGESSGESSISLVRDGERVNLAVFDGSREQSADVTGYSRELVELEEAGEPQKVKISLTPTGDFVIFQNGVKATTSYSIYINPKNRELILDAPSGKRYLAIMPYEAVAGVMKANIVNILNQNSEIALSEEAGGELLYQVGGERKLAIGKVFEFSVPVTAKVSATNGKIIDVEQPVWLVVLGFLFS